MKLFPMLLAGSLALGGCQTMPDLADTTKARLRLRVHYDTPGLTTPHVEMTTQSVTLANRCVYVREPFGIVANVADSGGVRSVRIGPSQFFDAITARTNEGDVVAIPSPAEATQGTGSAVYPNPGVEPGSAVTNALYSTAKAFDTVTLMSVYQFRNGATRASFYGTARNFGDATGVSQIYHFYVEKATSDPARQPGMSCFVPPGG